jgi:MFS family permease
MNRDTDTKNSPEIKLPSKSFPWVVVILGTLLLLVAYIYNYTFGVFFKPIAEDFGWSRATIAGAYAIRALVGVVLVVPMGYWADRYGPRRVLLPSLILLGIGTMAVAKVTTIWQLYLIQGVVIGISMAAPFTCILSTVAKWHDTRRGLALGIAAAGIGLSSVIFPPLATKLMGADNNWQFATLIMGTIILVIGVPASLFFRDPTDIVKQQLTGTSSDTKGIFVAWSSIPQFLRNPMFLVIIIMFTLTSIASNMLTSHLVNYATDIGITALVAAGMMSVMGVASTIGRLAMGIISDWMGAKKDAAVCCLLLALSFILLISKIPALMWVAAALFGIGFGGMAPLAVAIMGERVDTDQLSTATGAATMGLLLGATIGPWVGGLIFDTTGSYLWALLLAMLVSIVALIINLSMPPARRKIPQKSNPLLKE